MDEDLIPKLQAIAYTQDRKIAELERKLEIARVALEVFAGMAGKLDTSDLRDIDAKCYIARKALEEIK